MKLVYSYWSLPTKFDKTKQENTKWLYAISVAYAKILGYETTLHTDTLGAQILKSIPFDEVKMTLDAIAVDPGFWSYPKIAALKNEKAPFIHIDGDAWIKTPYLRNLLDETKYDVAVQMTEEGQFWEDSYEPFKEYVQEHVKDKVQLLWRHKRAFNTGILSFKDDALKDLFIKRYETMMYELRGHTDKPKLNVLTEQFNLYSLCVIGDYNVFQVLDYKAEDKDFNEIAKEIGFTHLWGQTKWEPHVQQQVKDRIKEINPDYYEQILNG